MVMRRGSIAAAKMAVVAATAAVLASCSVGLDPTITNSNPASFAGQTYYACQDKIAKTSSFEASGLAKQRPQTREQLAAYADYVIALDHLYLSPDCHKRPGEGGLYWGPGRDIQGSANFLSALTSTVPPGFAAYGKSGEDIYVNALSFGTPASEIDRLLKDGTVAKLAALRDIHAAAKAALGG